MHNIFLLGTARTGTTFLRNVISKSRDFKFYGEFLWPDYFDWGFYHFLRLKIEEDEKNFFRHNDTKSFNNYFDWISGINKGQRLFFDLKLEQSEEFPGIVNSVFTNKNKFILLTRKNLLAQACSEFLMYERIKRGDNVVHRKDVPEPIKLNLPPERYLSLIKSKIRLNEKYLNILKERKLDYIEITYEDLAEGNFGDVVRFLGLTISDFSSSLSKQNPDDLRALIENYDEVVKFLVLNGIKIKSL